MQFLSSISGLPISAQSAAYAPTNSADVSAIASAYAESAASAAYQSATAGGGGGGGGAYVPLSATEVAIGSYNYALSNSFAQGMYNSANQDSFVQGESNTAYYGSFAQGRNNKAEYYAFAQGLGNRAGDYAAVFGQYNIYDDNDIALAYGDGSADNRHNLFEFRKNGTLTLFSGINDTAGFEVRSAIESKQNTLTFGYDGSSGISSINGSAIAGGSGGGGGGASGDQYVYHAPAHSIIFCFENTSYNPTTDSNVSSLGTWTQLSAGSNIWQLTMSTGSWANKFYDSGTGATKLSQRCEILSIDFTGVTSLQNFMRGAQVTRIREIRSSIECSADGAFQGTSELRGHVEFPALHGTTFASMFRNSGVDSIRINSLYNYMTPGWEGDPEMGEMGADDWYEGATCSSMFCECHRLRNVEIYGAHVGACDSMFKYCDSLAEIPCMEGWDFCGGSFSYMFYWCRSLIWVPNISCYHPAWQGSMDSWTNGGNTDYMFYECISLQRMPYFNGHFGECSSTAYMFFNCSSLISIKWENISELGYYSYMEWDEESQMETEVSTYVVQNVSQMFQNCGNVLHGAVGVYQGMTNYWNQITSNGHGGTFSNCGTDVGSTELASIPRNWGGTQS